MMTYQNQIDKIKEAYASHAAYDKLLTELPKDGEYGRIEASQIDLEYLKAKGFIEYRLSIVPSYYDVKITSLGMVFISEDGFINEDNLKINDLNLKNRANDRENRTNMIAQYTLWATIAGIAVTVVFQLIN